MNRARRAIALLLLAAYMPLLVASVFHTHRPVSEMCSQCAAHESHPAHFSQTAVAVQDCAVCQAIGAPRLLLASVVLPLLVLTARRVTAVGRQTLPLRRRGERRLRAPPAWE